MKKKIEKMMLPLTIIIILLVSLYRFAESSFFLEKIIIPVIEHQTGCQITADLFAFSLPGNIRIHNVKISRPEAGFKIKADVLTADLPLSTLLTGNLAVKELSLQNAAGYYSYYRASQQAPLMITWKDMKLHINDLSPDHSAQLKLSSQFNLPNTSAKISYGGYIQTSSVITISKADNKISTQTKGHITDLQAKQAETVSEQFEVPFSLVCTVGMNELNEFRSLRIKNFETEVSSFRDNKKQMLAHLAVNGKVFLPQSNRQNKLQVSSKKLNLRLLNSLTLTEGPADKQNRSSPLTANAPHNGPAPANSPSSTDADKDNSPLVPHLEHLGKVKTTIDLDLKNISYDNFYITHLLGNIEQTDHSIQTALATDSLNESSPLKAIAQMKNFRNTPQYSLAATLQNLRISPVLTTFTSLPSPSAPKAHIDSLKLRLKSHGRSIQHIKHNAQGLFMADFAKISFNNLQGLQDIAAKYKLPELSNLHFKKGRIRSEISNGNVLLKLVRIQSDNLNLHFNGSVGLDSTINTSVQIGVGGALKKRLIKRGFQPVLGKTVNGFRRLRISIPIKGTLEKPEVDFSFSSFIRQSMNKMRNKWLKNFTR